jgi:phage terminase large subunit
MTQYCIGGDTSGDGSDYFVGQVLDAKTGEQVAVLRHQFDADQYTKQMYCLGKYYKDALIGIEANFDSFPLMELQRLGYKNQYVREAQDTYTGKTKKSFGFKTTSLTRPTAISRLIEIVREHCYLLNDKATLEELLTIIRNEKGRIEAPQGGHDDMMMSLAIAYQVKEQVVFRSNPIVTPRTYNFGIERENARQYDYGEEIVIV